MNYSAIVTVLAFVVCAAPGQGAVLITPQEAQLLPAQIGAPPAQIRHSFGAEHGIVIPRPDVSLESPKGPAVSPFLLRVIFKPHNGARIDPDSVTVTLLTKPEIDLTNRLRPYISATGVNFSQAETPPGKFPLRITLADNAGNSDTYMLELQVQNP